MSTSLKSTRHLLDLSGKREIVGRVLQCRTGHGYMGEYYSQFVPSQNVDCHCGETFQTRKYIIRECPLYEEQRGHSEMCQDPYTYQTSSAPRKESQYLANPLKTTREISPGRENHEARDMSQNWKKKRKKSGGKKKRTTQKTSMDNCRTPHITGTQPTRLILKTHSQNTTGQQQKQTS